MADPLKAQGIVAQAIEEYTDRHNSKFAEEGARDIKTLSNANPQALPQSIKYFYCFSAEI
jgi:hypothetical protein